MAPDTLLASAAMWSPATCHTCGMTTWTGCGAHVDQVMSRVPEARRCTCDDSRPPQRSLRERRSLGARFGRLLGR